MDIPKLVHDLACRARAASERCAELTTAQKNHWLKGAAKRLESARESIFEANQQDLAEAREKKIEAPLLERLELTKDKWKDMLAGLADVAALDDPVGRIEESQLRPNGLEVARMRIPLGVIGIIYESRPNVTVDAAALCIKAGNAVILRGGSEALHSNLALALELRAAAQESDVPEDAICIVPTPERSAIDALLHESGNVDLIIPRGGPGLIQRVTESSRIPVIKHDAGICHIYVDENADTEMATRIVADSKLRQMSVCNGLETLLIHRAAAESSLSKILAKLHEEGVEIRGDTATRGIFADAQPASEADWATEYLGPILSVRVVEGIDEAIEHVRRYGSDHTEVIVTRNPERAQEWLRRVNSSTVGVNCSTAFADGYRLGLGAEIGISTSKLHAYGPMGLEGLTARKFVLRGDGQLRE